MATQLIEYSTGSVSNLNRQQCITETFNPRIFDCNSGQVTINVTDICFNVITDNVGADLCPGDSKYVTADVTVSFTGLPPNETFLAYIGMATSNNSLPFLSGTIGPDITTPATADASGNYTNRINLNTILGADTCGSIGTETLQIVARYTNDCQEVHTITSPEYLVDYDADSVTETGTDVTCNTGTFTNFGDGGAGGSSIFSTLNATVCYDLDEDTNNPVYQVLLRLGNMETTDVFLNQAVLSYGAVILDSNGNPVTVGLAGGNTVRWIMGNNFSPVFTINDFFITTANNTYTIALEPFVAVTNGFVMTEPNFEDCTMLSQSIELTIT